MGRFEKHCYFLLFFIASSGCFAQSGEPSSGFVSRERCNLSVGIYVPHLRSRMASTSCSVIINGPSMVLVSKANVVDFSLVLFSYAEGRQQTPVYYFIVNYLDGDSQDIQVTGFIPFPAAVAETGNDPCFPESRSQKLDGAIGDPSRRPHLFTRLQGPKGTFSVRRSKGPPFDSNCRPRRGRRANYLMPYSVNDKVLILHDRVAREPAILRRLPAGDCPSYRQAERYWTLLHTRTRRIPIRRCPRIFCYPSP